MTNSILRRLQALEESQTGLPLGYVYFEDGSREKWDLTQISRAFLGDGCGVVRVEWVKLQRGILYELFSDAGHWHELRLARHPKY